MYKARDQNEEMVILYTFLTKGIDAVDINFIKMSYSDHLQKEPYARTEGFYKLDLREKAKHKYHHAKANTELQH